MFTMVALSLLLPLLSLPFSEGGGLDSEPSTKKNHNVIKVCDCQKNSNLLVWYILDSPHFLFSARGTVGDIDGVGVDKFDD